jgi:hypothetical protein
LDDSPTPPKPSQPPTTTPHSPIGHSSPIRNLVVNATLPIEGADATIVEHRTWRSLLCSCIDDNHSAILSGSIVGGDTRGPADEQQEEDTDWLDDDDNRPNNDRKQEDDDNDNIFTSLPLGSYDSCIVTINDRS